MAQQLYLGWKAEVELTPLDSEGRPTKNWDEAAGVQYTTSDPAVSEVVDEDANPLDAVINPLVAAPGVMQTLTAVFDGKVGPEENKITLVSEEYEVVEPPPGEATSGVITLRFVQQHIEPPVEPPVEPDEPPVE
jgi:hypothetical protein